MRITEFYCGCRVRQQLDGEIELEHCQAHGGLRCTTRHDCGCVVWGQFGGCGWEPCPLHAHAGELLAACAAALEECGRYGMCVRVRDVLEAAVRAAKGG